MSYLKVRKRHISSEILLLSLCQTDFLRLFLNSWNIFDRCCRCFVFFAPMMWGISFGRKKRQREKKGPRNFIAMQRTRRRSKEGKNKKKILPTTPLTPPFFLNFCQPLPHSKLWCCLLLLLPKSHLPKPGGGGGGWWLFGSYSRTQCGGDAMPLKCKLFLWNTNISIFWAKL